MNLFERFFKRLPLPVYPYTMYMHRYQCLFVHIPKNAGSGVISTLGHKAGRCHAEWNHFYESNSRWFNRYHRFAICREPLYRLLSGYRYILRGGNRSKKDLALKKHIQQNSQDANDFIENLISSGFIMENIIFRPQYLFIFNDRYECMVNSLLRYESLSKDWSIMAEKYGLPTILKIKNTTINSVMSNEYAAIKPDNMSKIKNIYHMDYKLLGY